MIASPSGIVKFHHLNMLVVEYDGLHYVKIKPLSDFLGLTWKHTRTTLFTADNVDLYGIKQLYVAPVDENYDVDTQFSPPYGDEKKASNLPVYIRADRFHFFLARVNTARMRANGKHAAADSLSQLQKEWADVLNRYEKGETVRKYSDHKHLISILNTIEKTSDPAYKAALKQLADHMLKQMGLTVERPQKDLLH